MSTDPLLDHLIPGSCNPDTSALSRPRLFTHWVPRLQVWSPLLFWFQFSNTDRHHLKNLDEKSLLQFLQQPTHSRLKFIDKYLGDAWEDNGEVYAFTPWTPECIHNGNNTVIPYSQKAATTWPHLAFLDHPTYSQISDKPPTCFRVNSQETWRSLPLPNRKTKTPNRKTKGNSVGLTQYGHESDQQCLGLHSHSCFFHISFPQIFYFCPCWYYLTVCPLPMSM